MELLNLRESPELKNELTEYLQLQWANDETNELYRDCLDHATTEKLALPMWYALKDEGTIIGCAGLIPNDFISRMDLMPWLCALFIDEAYRGKNLSRLIIDQIKKDSQKLGYQKLYLCTDHVGLYEKMNFTYIGDGFHPWGEKSRIYETHV
ncbi:GNAT family N-acetyltransferase [Enterococcus sp. 669A]|uniref:GNAT family N-acetyltransferase n=1 Tax=Candidatus Enterococcus moelleringii TaxID=2815325 RepID=A0ABS3LC61_9ENTE|nr:GNAT family N-acetyltransferase [Enterococcus sp. 669A]MBO1306316.1 GNAT family N-acetyltransferase [Enterococcus sp. 669A]